MERGQRGPARVRGALPGRTVDAEQVDVVDAGQGVKVVPADRPALDHLLAQRRVDHREPVLHAMASRQFPRALRKELVVVHPNNPAVVAGRAHRRRHPHARLTAAKVDHGARAVLKHITREPQQQVF